MHFFSFVFLCLAGDWLWNPTGTPCARSFGCGFLCSGGFVLFFLFSYPVCHPVFDHRGGDCLGETGHIPPWNGWSTKSRWSAGPLLKVIKDVAAGAVLVAAIAAVAIAVVLVLPADRVGADICFFSAQPWWLLVIAVSLVGSFLFVWKRRYFQPKKKEMIFIEYTKCYERIKKEGILWSELRECINQEDQFAFVAIVGRPNVGEIFVAQRYVRAENRHCFQQAANHPHPDYGSARTNGGKTNWFFWIPLVCISPAIGWAII